MSAGPLSSSEPSRCAFSGADSQLVPSLSNGLYGLVTTKAVDAQAAGYEGAGVKACVADTALDTKHVDIAANFKGGIDTFDNDNDPSTDATIAVTEQHGTHVGGTLLGVDNHAGIFGVAPSASLYHARVLGTQADGSVSGTTSQVMAGVQWLAETAGCKVVNMSLGGGTRSKTEEDLYKKLYANGTLIVAAAGNSARSRLDYPGGYNVVVSVAAVDRNNVLADFSSFGHGLDLSGPGVDVLSSVPRGEGRERDERRRGRGGHLQQRRRELPGDARLRDDVDGGPPGSPRSRSPTPTARR